MSVYIQAADSFRGCPEYRSMVGGYFTTHPRYRDYQVSIVDNEHEITQVLMNSSSRMNSTSSITTHAIMCLHPRCGKVERCPLHGQRIGVKAKYSTSHLVMIRHLVSMICLLPFFNVARFGQALTVENNRIFSR